MHWWAGRLNSPGRGCGPLIGAAEPWRKAGVPYPAMSMTGASPDYHQLRAQILRPMLVRELFWESRRLLIWLTDKARRPES